MTAPKRSIQAVQDTRWHLLKMIVAKKTEPNRVRYKMAPFKNDCGQKYPIQAVQVTKWHLLKKTVAKKKEPSSGRFQKTPSKHNCSQKNPIH